MRTVEIDIPKPKKGTKVDDSTPEYLPRFPFSLLVVGKRLSGKSSLLTACILEAWKDNYSEILVFSPTCKSDAQWSTVGDLDNVFFSESITGNQLEGILLKQAARWKKGKSKKNRILIVLDDMSSTIKNKKSGLAPALDKYYTTCRHFGVSIALCAQNYTHASTTIRGNSNQLWVFKISDREAKILSQEHPVPWMTDKQFLETVHKATSRPYAFLNIDWARSDPTYIIGEGFRE
jgi:hypothetical protein